MSQPNLKWRLLAKAEQVIKSCKTKEQLKVAEKFASLALDQAPSPAYAHLVESASDYYHLQLNIWKLLDSCQQRMPDN